MHRSFSCALAGVIWLTALPGGAAEPSTPTELRGVVVKIEPQTLYVKHEGAVVPLTITGSTRFDDRHAVQEGRDIRVAFKVEQKIRNVATTVMTQTGTGGSGPSADEPFHPVLPERVEGPLPEEPGTQPR